MLESGSYIADYQIVAPLDENPVYESYQAKAPDGSYAQLLLIAPEQLADKANRQAFLAQAKVLLGQSFPGLCSLLAAASVESYSFCLYPFATGQPLAEQLSEEFSIRRSLEIVRQLANTLSPAHEVELWHGNISPATIFLDGDSVSLAQFALPSLLSLDFHSGIDPRYSSPELVRGESLGPASDLYSLGILLYRLLTGEVPFQAEEPFATAMLHVQEQTEPLPESLAMLQPLIDGLLVAVPSERWSTERLITELDEVLQRSELDELQRPVRQHAAEQQEDTEQSSVVEQVVAASDMATRIEQRLQMRAEALQDASPLTAAAKRAGSEGISAIGQKSYRQSQGMKTQHDSQKLSSSRFYVTLAIGIAVGIIIYLTIFGENDFSVQQTTQMPEDLRVGLEKGSQLLAQGELTKAEQTFAALSSEYALFPQPYNNLAAVYANRGDLERARTILERAMATDSFYAVVYRNLGTVYSEMARDSYGRALQLEAGQQAVNLQVFDGAELLAVAAQSAPEKEPELLSAAEQESTVEPIPTEVVAETTPETTAAADTEPTTQPAAVTEQQPPAGKSEPAAPEPETVERFLQRWAEAWSEQNVSAYLGFYAEDFVPASGLSRQDWEKQRDNRLNRPAYIEVTLEDFSVSQQADDLTRVELTQTYRSDRYADRTRKRFDLTYDGENWQILEERSLGRVR